MIGLLIVLFLITLHFWTVLDGKPYYVRITNIGSDKEAMIQTLKLKLETTRAHAAEIVDQAPYLVAPGNFFHALSLVYIIWKNGGKARLTKKRFFSSDSKFVEGPIR